MKTERTLCAYPDCKQAGKDCYTESFASQNYWKPSTAAEAAACQQVVRLSTSVEIASRGSTLEMEFIGSIFGGMLSVATDLYLGWLEVLTFGCFVAIAANFLLLVLLRHFIKALFFATLLGLLVLLALVDAICLAKAGILDLPALTTQAIGASGASAASHTLGLPADHAAAIASLASSPIFDAAAAESRLHWRYGAYAGCAVTVAVLLLVGVLWAKVDNALEICREATNAVFENKALVALPLFSTLLALLLIGYFIVTSVYILTPDPESITQQIDDITQAIL